MGSDLHTERFLLKKMCDEDYDFLVKMYADQDVMRYISTGTRDSKKARESLEKFIKHWNDRGFGMWIVHSKQDYEKLGYMGFRCLDGKDGIEFGGLLIKKAWGKGAATEIGKACLLHGFDHYKFKLIYAVVDPNNAASHRWIEKIGMKRDPSRDGIFHNSFTNYYFISSK